jgi:hypothetical protein
MIRRHAFERTTYSPGYRRAAPLPAPARRPSPPMADHDRSDAAGRCRRSPTPLTPATAGPCRQDQHIWSSLFVVFRKGQAHA